MGKVNLAQDTDKRALREAYQQALADLEQIQNTNLNNVNKLQAAVKAHATITKKLLKGIKRLI